MRFSYFSETFHDVSILYFSRERVEIESTGNGIDTSYFSHAAPYSDYIPLYGGSMKKHVTGTALLLPWNGCCLNVPTISRQV